VSEPPFKAHILVAEDDPRQAEVVRRYLVSAGYEATIVHDGATALNRALADQPDLVVLDVMMPGLDGLTVCRKLRASSNVPIFMLTALSTEDDLLTGLDTGADDYLTKPYSPRELTARIRTLLRRTMATPPSQPTTLHRIGALTVDPARHRATLDGQEIDCTPDEFALLAVMAAQPGRVFTRAQLLTHTSGLERSSTERSIDVHVMNLRRKIESDARRPEYLRTVYGVGYRFGTDHG
jgi:two-component system response regulator MtrA